MTKSSTSLTACLCRCQPIARLTSGVLQQKSTRVERTWCLRTSAFLPAKMSQRRSASQYFRCSLPTHLSCQAYTTMLCLRRGGILWRMLGNLAPQKLCVLTTSQRQVSLRSEDSCRLQPSDAMEVQWSFQSSCQTSSQAALFLRHNLNAKVMQVVQPLSITGTIKLCFCGQGLRTSLQYLV